MPTGYTADVQSGKTTEFKEYALKCARAFLVDMRDDPHDAEIRLPELNKYHDPELEKAENELKMFNECSDELLKVKHESQYRNNLESWEKSQKKKREQKSRYERMLWEAENYKPPSDKHVEFKNFMISQLEESIDWDCRPRSKPEMEDFENWKTKTLKDLEWAVEYHTKGLAEDAERFEQGCEWINLLKQSLGE